MALGYKSADLLICNDTDSVNPQHILKSACGQGAGLLRASSRLPSACLQVCDAVIKLAPCAVFAPACLFQARLNCIQCRSRRHA